MKTEYTVKEVDALRAALTKRFIWGTTAPYTGNEIRYSRQYQSGSLETAVEQMLRTHMAAGHTAEDIFAADNPPTQ